MDASFETLRNAICDVKRETRDAMLRVIACGALLIASGCSPAPGPCARLGGAPMLEYHLFFGRASVTDPAWAEFTAHVITPQLPDGFTVLDANGQWMNPAHASDRRERTKCIVVAVPDISSERRRDHRDQGRLSRTVSPAISRHHRPCSLRRILIPLRRQFVADRGLDLDRLLHRRPCHHALVMRREVRELAGRRIAAMPRKRQNSRNRWMSAIE